MSFDEWFAEISKVTTFFHAGVCKSLAIAAWEAATKAEREACAKACESECIGESVDYEPDNEPDHAYNTALRHGAKAIRMRSN